MRTITSVKEPWRKLLGGTGFGTLATGAVATFLREPQAVDIALIMSGAGLTALASLQPLLESFKINQSGLEAKFRDAEDDIAEGKTFDAKKGVEAVDTALRVSAGLTVKPQLSAEAKVSGPEWQLTDVKLSQEAIGDLFMLSDADRDLVAAQLVKLEGKDPKVIKPQSDGGLAYHVRTVRKGLRIYYRLLEPPNEWIVVTIGE